jgi:hypothetical protein
VNGTPVLYARRAVVNNFIQDKTRGTARGSPAPELPRSQREVMERIADGLSYEEIAQDLGKSREVARSRLCDARARLIQILNPDGGSAGRPRPATARHSPEGPMTGKNDLDMPTAEQDASEHQTRDALDDIDEAVARITDNDIGDQTDPGSVASDRFPLPGAAAPRGKLRSGSEWVLWCSSSRREWSTGSSRRPVAPPSSGDAV